MSARDSFGLLKATYQAWAEDNASTMAAALAYFTAFAIAPLLIIVIEIGAALLGGAGRHHIVENEILRNLQPSIGTSGTGAIRNIVSATFNQKHSGPLAGIVSWVVFIAAATGLFIAVQNALDRVWHVKAPKTGFVGMLLDRVRTIGIIGLLSVVLLVSFAANAGVTALSGTLAAIVPGWHYALIAVEAIVSFVVVSAGFAMIFKFLPRTTVDWKDVLTGGAMTGAFFMVGQYLIGFYLGRASTASTYGAAGSFVALLIWLYYSAQIFLFGAEFTKVYASRYGSKIGDASSTAIRGTVAGSTRMAR